MIDTKLRKSVQPIFDGIAHQFMRFHISPRAITLTAFGIGTLSGILISQDFMTPAFIALWLSGLLDVVDGTVARLTNQASKKGAFMDLVLDRMVESMVILGFYYVHPEFAFAYLLFFVAVLFNFTTFTVAGALFENNGNKSMHYDVGFAERTETFIAFSLMMFFPKAIFQILMIFNFIVFITGFKRYRRIMKSDQL